MGGKTFPIGHIGSLELHASVAIFVIPIIFTINDVIVEVHGKDRAQSVVRSGLLMVFFLFAFAWLAVHLPPSVRSKTTEPAYDTVFGQTIRLSVASLIAFAGSEFLDVFIFAKLKQKMGKQGLWLRNNISNIISQFFDSFIFIFLAFYALDKSLGTNIPFLFSLILPYWILKCCMSIIETPFVYLGVKWLKKDKV
jgi:uncharacterized integral membrane protein (TIGR00697 family)